MAISNKEKQAGFRKKMKSQGYANKLVWLSEEALLMAEKEMKERNLNNLSEAINNLILNKKHF